ncbi:MAG: GIY-YIG nuclease family protein [Gemmatimonadaceae bacterium]
MRTYYVYILSNSSRSIYTGVTNNIYRRLTEHRDGLVRSTREYKLSRLVYVESTNDVRAAIAREKQIKGWRREKKLALIVSTNPAWDDLLPEWRT